MNEITRDASRFVGYEYKDIIADNDKASMYLDGYMSFGWVPDDNIKPSQLLGVTTIKLKRDRKIINKVELTRLQRHFESCMNEITEMERSKNQPATMWAIVVGVIGTAFMAGSVFAVVSTPPIIWLCILLAIPAFIGWALPLFIYKRVALRRTQEVTPLIEQKYDELYAICEKGTRLLS